MAIGTTTKTMNTSSPGKKLHSEITARIGKTSGMPIAILQHIDKLQYASGKQARHALAVQWEESKANKLARDEFLTQYKAPAEQVTLSSKQTGDMGATYPPPQKR